MITLRHLITLMVATTLALAPVATLAQETTTDENDKINKFTIDAELMTRSELRYGGLPTDAEDTDNKAYFILERTRLALDYERTFLKAHITAQHNAIWGQAGKGSFNIYEAWA